MRPALLLSALSLMICSGSQAESPSERIEKHLEAVKDLKAFSSQVSGFYAGKCATEGDFYKSVRHLATQRGFSAHSSQTERDTIAADTMIAVMRMADHTAERYWNDDQWAPLSENLRLRDWMTGFRLGYKWHSEALIAALLDADLETNKSSTQTEGRSASSVALRGTSHGKPSGRNPKPSIENGYQRVGRYGPPLPPKSRSLAERSFPFANDISVSESSAP